MAGRLHRKRQPDQASEVQVSGPQHSSVGVEGITESLRYTRRARFGIG